TIHLRGTSAIEIATGAIQLREPAARTPERTLILGWNWRAPAIVNELDRYVAPGSVTTLVADDDTGEEAITRRCADLTNQAITFQAGDTTDRRTLEALEIDSYKHVIILCYSDMLDAQQADARTLITLLHLRE